MSRIAAFFAGCLVLPFPAGAGLPAPATGQPAPTCGDFLAEMHKKPAHTQFVRCTPQPDRQGKPLRAVYHVSGAYAAQAENDLRRSTGLIPLKRSCCQWDAPVHQFTADGREFGITMVSGATDVATRARWPKIAGFEIIVDTMTDEP